MKVNGTRKFSNVSSQQVFQAILDPEVLKSTIPGCNLVEYLDPNHIEANITPPLPGLNRPYNAVIRIVKRQDPSHLVLRVQHKGKGGSIKAEAQISLAEEADGTLLSYDANADLNGPISIVNNPIGQGFFKSSLNSFFAGVEKAMA